MSLIKQTKKLLRIYQIHPKKRYGQNFMVDSTVLQRLVSHADLSRNDVVLEVGAGFGFLTRLLAERCRKVVAFEVDPKLVQALRKQFAGLENVELVEGDILKARLPSFDKVVSTPPYSISSPLLFKLLEQSFKLAVLTFQQEFAERLVASVGSKDYSRLTVATYYKADVELLDHVPRAAFFPSPDVDSTIVKLKPKKEPPFHVNDEKEFFELLKIVFTQRNKKLRNAVLNHLLKRRMTKAKAQELADSLTFYDKRVRDLAPEDFGALTNEILEKTSVLR
jgi:16S rRNA (adenine1518-N6/adenine1519-N6)-dimethyltransferase